VNPIDEFKDLTNQQGAAQARVDELGARRARLLAEYHLETGLSYANIASEVGLKRGTVQQLVERGRKILPRLYEIIASSGREVDWGNPTPTWGYTDGADSFIDQVHYFDGDEITDAIERFQEAEKMPAGEVTVVNKERCYVDWVHEDQAWRFFVEIVPS